MLTPLRKALPDATGFRWDTGLLRLEPSDARTTTSDHGVGAARLNASADTIKTGCRPPARARYASRVVSQSDLAASPRNPDQPRAPRPGYRDRPRAGS